MRLGIALRTSEINTGSKLLTEPVLLAPDAAFSVMNPRDAERSSAIAFSWFSRIAAVTARLWGSVILPADSSFRTGAHFSISVS